MAHFTKFTAGASGHMLQHYDRSKEMPENIDQERTHLNYNLAEQDQPKKQMDYIHGRLSEIKVQKRKDVNVLCDWIVTAPKDLPQSEQPAFFRSAYNFLREQYGSKNIVSAYVHMDEVTPHMHFAFVPVVQDKKHPEREKLSAKEAVTRGDLNHFHLDLSERISADLGHEVSILNDATKEKNKSVQELKEDSAVKIMAKARADAAEIVSKAQDKARRMLDNLPPLQAEYEAKKAYIRECDKASDISMEMPDYAKVNKSLLGNQTVTVPLEKWQQRHVSVNEKECLERATREFENKVSDFRITGTAMYSRKLEQKVKELEQELSDTKMENNKLKYKVKEADQKCDELIDRVNNTLENIPNNVADKFLEQWKIEKSLERGYEGRSR